MATMRKRGDKWRVEICKNGIRRSKTCKTKAEATQWALEEEKKLELQEQGLQPETVLADVVERYLKEITPTKRGIRHETLRLVDTFAPWLSRFALCVRFGIAASYAFMT